MTRDQERRQEVLDMFSELDRQDLADQVLFERMLSRRESRRAACLAWYHALPLAQRRAMHQRQWQRRGPEERARRAAREKARYQRLTPAERRERNSRLYASVKADHVRMARRRERSAENMRRYRMTAATQAALEAVS